jgi:hypothetical protein
MKRCLFAIAFPEHVIGRTSTEEGRARVAKYSCISHKSHISYSAMVPWDEMSL